MCNIATLARLGRAGLAGLALVILPASLAEAVYGPKTKIGKNYQQSSDTQSTNGADPGICSGSSFCYVLFQRPPQQQPLIVQHVACRLNIPSGSPRYVYLGTRKGQTFPFRRTPLVPVSTSGTWWAVNSPVMHLLKSGERPYVVFQNSAAPAGWNIDCSISGKLR